MVKQLVIYSISLTILVILAFVELIMIFMATNGVQKLTFALSFVSLCAFSYITMRMIKEISKTIEDKIDSLNNDVECLKIIVSDLDNNADVGNFFDDFRPKMN